MKLEPKHFASGTRRNTMLSAKVASRGFTLIASLLLLLLLSGFALALLMTVNSEQRAGGYDLNETYTYRTTEGAMEKMTSDLANTFKNIQAPNASQICALSANYPTWDSTVSYSCASCAYNVAPISGCVAPLTTVWGPIQSGPDAGLYAQIIPVNMNVTAQRVDGLETVSMSRTAEVALIPVFQFGVFCNGDCFFGRSPNLAFAGRVHTNGDLYLGVADGASLVFGDKISAFGNVIREQMDNVVPSAGNDNGGTVLIPTTSNGCSAQLLALETGGAVAATATCVDISAGWGASPGLGATNGSVTGGHGSGQNAAWQNVSLGTYNGYIIDGNGVPPATNDGPNATGASDLTLPFVQGTTSAVQIIRRPPIGEAISSLLGGSRLANEAQIRILLSDTQDGLHLSDWNGVPAQDVQLVSALPTTLAALLQAPDTVNPGIQAGAMQVGNVFPIASGHYYSFGESYCTGSTYSAAGAIYSSVGTNYAVNSSSTFGSAPNKLTFTYNGATTRQCPTILGTGTYSGAATVTDTNFVIPPFYGSPSQAWPPTAFPQWPPQTFTAPTSAANFNTPNGSTNGLEWPLIGGWLLVEVKWASDGKWHGVTQEWLQMGFARGLNVPTQPGFTCAVPPATNTLTTAPGCNFLADHKNAILYFQQTKDSKLAGAPAVGPGSVDQPLTASYYDTAATNTKSQYNWYPINFYDTREGENNDSQIFPAGSGTPNGIMNAVELDVGNLRNWLLGNTGLTGKNVDYVTQNGYILYFSDRRGMQFATPTTPENQWGEYGFEDTVNYANAGSNFKPDGKLDPNNYNGVSAEDVNGNSALDNYGVLGVGDAFGPATTKDTDGAINPPTPYAQTGGTAERIPLVTIGLANRVTGARHVLKLVDGSLGNLPTMPPVSGCSYTTTTGAPNPTGCGGFTIAAENPVYILGNYNTNCAAAGAQGCTPNNATYDPTWTNPANPEPNHSAASIMADAVTMLSNNWRDAGCLTVSATCTNAINQTSGSLVNPLNPGGQAVPAQTPNRIAMNSYYRAAIAGGKTIAFSNTAQNPEFSFGMDGGIHNFLRFVEDWGGTTGTQAALYYKGSLVSLYWNQYATGTFKCCNLVYNPPDREYVFDPLFAQPSNLPPGTPMFRNVDNLSYRQNQVARSN
jgi:Tfp pilus assembly protein PilX